MSLYEFALAQAMIEERRRQAEQQRLAREVRATEKPAADAPPVRQARRPSRFWRLVHLRHTYT